MGDEILRLGALQREVDLLRARIRLADAQVLLDGTGKQHRLLKHDADVPPQRLERHVADVHVIDRDGAGVGIEHAVQQAERRRLARAGRAHERDGLPRLHLEGHILNRPAPLVIGETYMTECDAAADPTDVHRAWPVGHRRPGVEHIEEILQFGQDQQHPVDEAHHLLQPADEHGGKIHEGDDLADCGETLQMQRRAQDEDRHQRQRG